MKNKEFKLFVVSSISFIISIIMFSKLNQDYTTYIIINTPDFIKFDSSYLTFAQKFMLFRYEYWIGLGVLFLIILWCGELAYDEYRRCKK